MHAYKENLISFRTMINSDLLAISTLLIFKGMFTVNAECYTGKKLSEQCNHDNYKKTQ